MATVSIRKETELRFGRAIQIALTVTGVAVAFYFAAFWVPMNAQRVDAHTSRLDLVFYYDAAVRLALGQPLYTGYFVYPPFFAALIRPMAMLSFASFQAAWYWILFAGFWAYAAGLARLAFGRATFASTFAAGALVALVPGTSVSMGIGNADILIWAVVAWSLGGAGEGLVLGGCLKVYPAVAAAVVFLRRREVAWRQLGAALAATTFTIGALGAGPVLEWVKKSGAPLPVVAIQSSNVSPTTALALLLHLFDHPAFVRPFYGVCMLLVVGLAYRLTRRWSEIAASTAVMMVFVVLAPVCWWYWLPFGLVPAAVAMRVRGARWERS